jgi:hypothetical protein
MMFSNMPVQHGAMLVHRGRLPRDFAWYRPGATTAEDVELLFRLLQHGELANLDETVLEYRLHGNNNSLRQAKKTFLLTLRARLKAVFAYGYRPTLMGLLVTCCQTVVVLLLPGRWVYPVFAVLRGIGPRRRHWGFGATSSVLPGHTALDVVSAAAPRGHGRYGGGQA